MLRYAVLSCAAALLALAPAALAQPAVAPAGATVAGIDVAGLDAPAATAKVEAAFAKPIVLIVGRTTFRVTPTEVGATFDVEAAVDAAIAAPAGDTAVAVHVTAAGVRGAVDRVVRRSSHRGTPPRWQLTLVRPILRLGRPGKAPRRREVEQRIRRALAVPALRSAQPRIRLREVRTEPTVANVGYVIVVSKDERSLRLYAPWRKRGGVVRWFRVAVGAPSFPTPSGIYRIVEKQVDPWWNPPDSPWAEGEEPVPPGPSNPLGTRWMGLDRDGIGIHGTPDSGSIGGYASHGCIRMLISSAERLFALVPVGTPVIIH